MNGSKHVSKKGCDHMCLLLQYKLEWHMAPYTECSILHATVAPVPTFPAPLMGGR